MRAKYRAGIQLVILLGLVSVAGCGYGPPSVGAVRGKVSLNGQPLANVRIEFYPEGELGYLPSRATTTADGSYELICDDNRMGAVIGWHKIVVKPIRGEPGGGPRDEWTADNPNARTPKAKLNLTPYQHLASTRERREVAAGENNIDLTLGF